METDQTQNQESSTYDPNKLIKTMDLSYTDVAACDRLLENTTVVKEKKNFLQISEYQDKYDGDRLYNQGGPSEVYVSKKANDESDFWKGGKYCYDDPLLKKEIVYLTKNNEVYKGEQIPAEFRSKEFNRTVTRISEYSNAKYRGGVFDNPSFLSC